MDIKQAIGSLTKKIEQLEKEKADEMRQIEETYNGRIRELQTAINVNEELLIVPCSRCDGKGSIRKSVGYHDSETVICTNCEGTGKIKN